MSGWVKKVKGQTILEEASIREYLEILEGEQALTLIQSPCGVAIKGIEETAEQVTEDGGPRTAGHQVEGEQGQNNTGIPCRTTRLVTTTHPTTRHTNAKISACTTN